MIKSTRQKIRECLVKIKRRGLVNRKISVEVTNFSDKKFRYHQLTTEVLQTQGILITALAERNTPKPTVLINSTMSRPIPKLIKKHILHEFGHMYYVWLLHYRNNSVTQIIRYMHTYRLRRFKLMFAKSKSTIANWLKYALSPDELFAEAFAEYKNGNTSKEFSNIRQEFLKLQVKWNKIPACMYFPPHYYGNY